jgi:hypothetical protein
VRVDCFRVHPRGARPPPAPLPPALDGLLIDAQLPRDRLDVLSSSQSRQQVAHDVLSQHPALHRRPGHRWQAYVYRLFVHGLVPLDMEGGLSAEKSWGDFHMITDTNTQAERKSFASQSLELEKDVGIIEDATVECGRMDLIETQPIAQERTAFSDLSSQRLNRQVFDFLNGEIEAPRSHVCITPFGADRQIVARSTSRLQPARQESFGHSI